MVKQANPAFTPAQIKTRILETGDVVPGLKCVVFSGKRVNAANAVAGTLTENNDCVSPPPAKNKNTVAVGGGGGGGCLISWMTRGFLPDSALDPLRRVRDQLAQQGPWGRAVVSQYYRVSRAVISWWEGTPDEREPGGSPLSPATPVRE